MPLLRLLVRILMSFVVILGGGWLAHAQSTGQATVGVQKFGSYDGFPDTVDMGSLGLNLQIPLYSKAGRGRGTSTSFTLNNYTSYTSGYATDANGKIHYLTMGPGPSLGFLGAGSLTSTSKTSNCQNMPGTGTFTDTVYQYTDGQGTAHLFSGYSQFVSDSNNTCSSISQYGLTSQASDGSGYLISVPMPLSGITTITTPSGMVYSNFGLNSSSAWSTEDPNGNKTSLVLNNTGCAMWYPCMDAYGNITRFQIADTLNTTSLQVSGGGYSTDYSTRNPLLITYADDAGHSQSISLNYRMYPWGNSTVGLLDNVLYPDGSVYRFSYVLDSTGAPTTNPPSISSITLPTGGTISYSYPGGVTTCGSNPTYIPTLTRTTSDGTTTYSRTITSESTTSPAHCSILTSYTTVSKPNGDQTSVYFIVPQHLAINPNQVNSLTPTWQSDFSKTFETKRLVYDHSNLSTPIRTIMRCYNGATGDCTVSGVNEPVTQLAVSTTLDNGLTSATKSFYTTGNLPTEVDEYDFGASSPTRKTVTSYASLGNNISDRPSSVIVYDSAGNVAKKITYSYDETTPTAMTLPGHTTISGSRGNPTSVYQWLVSSNQSFRTQYAYDDAGEITATIDPKGNTTSYGYDTATDAYLTNITRPSTSSVAHVSTFGYGPNSGRVTSAYDENNQLTSYGYDSMYRPSSINYPDGGRTTFSYTPNSRTTNRLQQGAVWNTNTEQYDSYGRTAQSQLSGPDITTTTYNATTYDALGRVQNVYNPTRCSPATTNCGESTWGLTSYQYDALNRVTKVTQPDGNTVVTSYIGRATNVQDEGNGSQRVSRVSQTDALGRLRSVCEVASGPFVGSGGSSSSSLVGTGGTPSSCGQDISVNGFLTTYNYDALDNLTQVNQSGVASRHFNYDSLSRLTSATNPESGTTCYGTYSGSVCQGNGYDSNGNLVTKIDARGVIATFGYDALNRLQSKAYSDGTPGVTNTYDVAVDGLSILYPVGRLTKTATSDGKTATANSYDQMGRIKNQWQCTPQNCGSGYFSLPYSYDFLGNITSAGNGMGVTIGYGVNSAAQLTSVTSSLSDATHPPTLLSNVSYNPFGGMTATTLGNGATESFGYDTRARLQNISTNGGTPSSGSATISGSEQSIPGAPATAGTGSVTFSGTLQSKQVQTQTAAAGSGSVSIGGSEQSIPASPATSGTGSATISGTEGSVTRCTAINQRTGNCISWQTSADTGSVWVTVNGYTASVSYGAGSTPTNLASALANAVNTTTNIDTTVSASVSGTTVYLTARTIGTGSNYSLSSGSNSTYNGSNASFHVSVSGASLTGGHNAIAAVYDSGTVSVTVNGSTASYTYGQNDSASSVASSLASSLNSSLVSASSSGGLITLTARNTGAATNYSLSTSVTYDTSHFPGPSFSASPSGSTLTGGRDATYTTVYDSGNSTITANGHGNTISWSGSGTTASSIASALASNINADSGASVTASVSGSTVTLTAKTAGASTNYSLSSSSAYDSGNFTSASFSNSNSGSTLSGGHDTGATTYDSGSAWITVSGTQYSVSYGQGSTAASLANSLAQAINGSPASPVGATASSATVSLTSKEGGSSTNYSLSVGSSTTGSSFSQPSFTLASSGSTMTGGATGNVANVYSLALAYTPNSNVNSASDSVNGNWTYGYDPFNRVVSANQNNGQAVYNYVYDIAGNRWQQNGPHMMVLSFTGNNSTNNNRADGYSYDLAGNLLNDGTNAYTYDAENRIITAGPSSYVYDANGRRVRKTIAGGSVDFLYDIAGNQVAEVSSTGTWNRGEIYAGSRHLATYSNSTTFFSHADWLGTERVRTNVGSGVYETCTNIVFGDWLNCSNNDPSPAHFTGQEHDFESGLDNFIARHLTSNMGRFMSPDPANAGTTLEAPQTWNAYSYALNNPLKYIDPSGLDCIYLTDDGSHGGWIKQGDCQSDTDNGYYVDGSINGAIYDTVMDLTNAGISFDNENNWMTYGFRPYDTPFLNTPQAQCIGTCPNDATLVAGASPTMAALPSPVGPWIIGRDDSWIHSTQALCLGPAAKEFIGGLILKNDIDALAGSILGDAGDVKGPVGQGTAAVLAEKGLEAGAESKTAVKAVQSALREEGTKVSASAVRRAAKFGAKLAVAAHIAFAANDGREAYNACKE